MTERGSRRAGPKAVIVALAGVALLSACPTQETREKGPLLPPRVDVSVHYSAGSPLSGASPGHVDAGTAAEALAVSVTLIALEDLPEDLLDSLGSRTRLVIDATRRSPLRAAPRLTVGARAGEVPDPEAFVADLESGKHGRASCFAELQGALPAPGASVTSTVTATFEAERTRSTLEGEEPVQERLAILLSRRTNDGLPAVELAIELESPQGAPVETAAGSEITSQATPLVAEIPDEITSLDLLDSRPRHDVALIVPSPFDREEARAIAIVIEVGPPVASSSAHLDAFAACKADLVRDEVYARSRSRPVVAAATPSVDLGAAVRGLASPDSRRQALVALASATGAKLALDTALAGDDALVDAVAEAVQKAAALVPDYAVLPALGWAVEKATFAALRDKLTQDDVSPQVAVLLQRRAGAVGRNLVAFYGVVEGAASLGELEMRILTTNQQLLEDGSPGVRARAFEWLQARGVAPKGYDPLGAADERAAALDAVGTAAVGSQSS